jgi:hypothetical protein
LFRLKKGAAVAMMFTKHSRSEQDMEHIETLELIVDNGRIFYLKDGPWLETFYGSSVTVAFPRLEAAGWKEIATHVLIGVGTRRILHVFQRPCLSSRS